MNRQLNLGETVCSWAMVLGVGILLLGVRVFSADAQAAADQEAESQCLLNFAKYVEWPADAFTDTNAPIKIGCLSSGAVLDGLKAAASEKSVNGRKIQIIDARRASVWKTCNILFINSTDLQREQRALDSVQGHPVLTVGEGGDFLPNGGMIDFVKEDGKVRFHINVDKARSAKLLISSKLLNLADNLSGKH